MVERLYLTADRIDHTLWLVAADARSLLKLEERLVESSSNRYTYNDLWHNSMAKVESDLERAYREGTMSPKQERRYRELKGLLEQALPVVKRLGFTLPPVPLEDA